jgi:CRP-like cAMP-binding protein
MVGNAILNALSKKDFARITKQATRVSLDAKVLLHAPNELIEFVYFPLSGVISILSETERGGPIEVATVGNEGFAGLPAYLGAEQSPNRVIVQIPIEAFELGVAAFRNEVRTTRRFRELIDRYVQMLITQIAQSSACNRIHDIEKRCARWLLICHDRVDGDEFPLTHQFLSQMLGVRRAGVTEAVGALRDAGLIEYQRGLMQIVDRRGLERKVCSCYHIIRAEFDRLIS